MRFLQERNYKDKSGKLRRYRR